MFDVFFMFTVPPQVTSFFFMGAVRCLYEPGLGGVGCVGLLVLQRVLPGGRWVVWREADPNGVGQEAQGAEHRQANAEGAMGDRHAKPRNAAPTLTGHGGG